MIEITLEPQKPVGAELANALEELYIKTQLGFIFRPFATSIRRATVRFEPRDQGSICEIEVRLTSSSFVTRTPGSTRESAFARASESLDRKLFAEIHGQPTARGLESIETQRAA